MQQLAKFLKATGRRLRILAKVICHFLRNGKLGLKIAIKIPFSWRSKSTSKPIGPDGDRRRARLALCEPGLSTMVRAGRTRSAPNLRRQACRQDFDHCGQEHEAFGRNGLLRALARHGAQRGQR